MVDELELGVLRDVRQVLERTGLEIVDADDPVALLEQVIAEIRAEEPGATRDYRRRHRPGMLDEAEDTACSALRAAGTGACTRRRPVWRAPTSCAATVTPLSELVPRTKAHTFTLIAEAPTLTVFVNCALAETVTLADPR